MASNSNAADSPVSTYNIPPHGGTLVDRLVSGAAAEDLLARAAQLPRIALDARTAADAELLATGAFSPLDGFVRKNDYHSIIEDLRTASGAVFSIPITLTVSKADAASLKEGKEAALVGLDGKVAGTIAVDEIYALDREKEARAVYKTTEAKHPGVAWIVQKKDDELAVGGRITLARRTIERKFPAHHRDPHEVRALIAERGWRKTVAFQTRNPIHRAHEYLLRVALETVDGLVVHPLVGETKGDDVPAVTRMQCYQTLLDRYFPKDRVLLTVFPFAMRYAGPREAVLHAIARQNYGFSHFIVGRDHAGVGNYYGTYDAQRIFDRFPLPTSKEGASSGNELKIQLLTFEHSFWCRACGNVSSIKTCPHPESDRLVLSGTKVRELLSRGELPPPEYSRPEVASILADAYRQQAVQIQA
jgi:sulfate adenylyltransferase